MSRAEDSVMFALRELQNLEKDRLAAEARVREDKARAEARAERESRAREEHARRVAEEEARMRVERDLRARDHEAEQRIALLRAELDAVRADRERIHATVACLSDELPAHPRASGRGGWVAFGAAIAVAGALLGVLLARPPVGPQPIAPAPETVVASSEPAVDGEDPAPATEPIAVAAPEPPAVETPPTAPVPHTGGPDRPRPPVPPTPGMRGEPSDDPALDFEHCGDDPTCGLEL